ncbi:hypothetical protein STSP_15930 [Streptomyces jeddahensis]|uniref:Uncharacterized protein n=1 Tax=Streptomyces jeddahensis TaxID=1716141 RepID=A0A177HWJ1_9ACTN|nr:hypothetical protein STSP_15930 [Streptomyces jeddahensis]
MRSDDSAHCCRHLITATLLVMETNEHEHVIEVTDLRRVYGGGFEAVRGTGSGRGPAYE